jgi:hypothetical protein
VKFGIKKSSNDAVDENEVLQKSEINEDNLDDDDEEVFRRYREQRINEMKLTTMKQRFGDVEEISGQDFMDKVVKAGEGVMVVLHLYKQGIVLCSLINNFMKQLALKFPQTKFLKSISTLCIPNFPDDNLPGILIYSEGKCRKQIFGLQSFPANLTQDDLEWMLHKSKAIQSDLEEDPRKRFEKSSKFFVREESDEDQ